MYVFLVKTDPADCDVRFELFRLDDRGESSCYGARAKFESFSQIDWWESTGCLPYCCSIGLLVRSCILNWKRRIVEISDGAYSGLVYHWGFERNWLFDASFHRLIFLIRRKIESFVLVLGCCGIYTLQEVILCICPTAVILFAVIQVGVVWLNLIRVDF